MGPIEAAAVGVHGRSEHAGTRSAGCPRSGNAGTTRRKHTTTIGDNAFIGSGAMLVAPVTVHPGATIGAGSTIDKDAPPHALTLTRGPQRTLEGWKRPRKR